MVLTISDWYTPLFLKQDWAISVWRNNRNRNCIVMFSQTNSLHDRLTGGCMCVRSGSTLAQVMVPSGTKPLPKPMMVFCGTCHFYLKWQRYQFINWLWKIHLLTFFNLSGANELIGTHGRSWATWMLDHMESYWLRGQRWEWGSNECIEIKRTCWSMEINHWPLGDFNKILDKLFSN